MSLGIRAAAGLLILFCSATANLRAQTGTSGALTGVVTDITNAVVVNADVEIRDNDKGTLHGTRTDPSGIYEFFFLPPANYTLSVSHQGFREEKRAVHVRLGPSATVNVRLQVATPTTLVGVTSDAPLVDAANGDYSSTIDKRQISELPNPGNDLTYIVQTAPGVIMNTDIQGLANFSSLGMPGTSNLFTINGMNDNDPDVNLSLVGPLNLLLGQNQVQEATVINIAYSGQFGGAAGAIVNYITKSGSNDFHGNAQYYWNGSVVNANSWFNNAFAHPKPFSNANQWAASYGGPILRDKLFFFLNKEGLRLVIPQNPLVTIPSPQFEASTLSNIDAKFGRNSASDAFYRNIFKLYKTSPGTRSITPGNISPGDPLGCNGFVGPSGLGTNVPCSSHFLKTLSSVSSDTLASGRVDWNIGTNDRAFVQVQYDWGKVPVYLDPINPVFDAELKQKWWQGQLTETHTFGSSAASQFLLAGNYFSGIFQLRNTSAALTAFPASLSFDFAGPFSSFASANSLLGVPSSRPTTQVQLAEDVMKMHSKHKLGFGVNFGRTFYTRANYKIGALGNLTPQTLDAFFQGGFDPATPDTDFTTLTQSFSSGGSQRTSSYVLGVYGEDDWQVRPKLTLTFALRAEHQSNQACKRSCFARLAHAFSQLSHDPGQPYNQAILIGQKQALFNTDTLSWSPRFGFGWQPLGLSQNTVLRGGIGVFYDPLPGELGQSLSSNPPFYNSYTVVGNNLARGETSNLFNDAAASNAAFVNGFAAGQTLAQIQAAISDLNAAGFSPPAITVSTRRTHSPQYQRWSLELQQAFGANTSLSIAYTGHHGIHQLVLDPSVNAFGFGSLPPTQCGSPPVAPCSDPRFSKVTEIRTTAVSKYNGLVVSVRYRRSQGVFEASYTYGHAFDEVSNGALFPFTNTSITFPQDPNNLHGAYGPADYDVRHYISGSYVWDVPLPSIFHAKVSNSVLGGWQIAGTVFARTGFPYTVVDAEMTGRLAANNYFSVIYSVPNGSFDGELPCGSGAAAPHALQPCQPPQTLPDGTPNPNARFVQAGCETAFNEGRLRGASESCDGPMVAFAQGRNRFRGPGLFGADVSIMKNTNVLHWRDAKLGIGLQFFNIFNHPSFGLPVNVIPDARFGEIGYTQQPPTGIQGSGRGGDASARMIQLKAQLQF